MFVRHLHSTADRRSDGEAESWHHIHVGKRRVCIDADGDRAEDLRPFVGRRKDGGDRRVKAGDDVRDQNAGRISEHVVVVRRVRRANGRIGGRDVVRIVGDGVVEPERTGGGRIGRRVEKILDEILTAGKDSERRVRRDRGDGITILRLKGSREKQADSDGELREILKEFSHDVHLVMSRKDE